jgi:hypothetical protein
VLFSGDALVTYDPYRNLGGPRLLDGVNEDTGQAVTHARGDPTVARRRWPPSAEVRLLPGW